VNKKLTHGTWPLGSGPQFKIHFGLFRFLIGLGAGLILLELFFNILLLRLVSSDLLSEKEGLDDGDELQDARDNQKNANSAFYVFWAESWNAGGIQVESSDNQCGACVNYNGDDGYCDEKADHEQDAKSKYRAAIGFGTAAHEHY